VNKYASMIKVGHPKDLVIQSICHDLQCPADHPLFLNIITWLDRLSNGGSIEPIPTEADQLLRTKYERMQETGISGDMLHYTKYFDDLITKKRQEKAGEPVVFEFPQENKVVGIEINDRPVNDRDILTVAEEKSLAEKRALGLKNEALTIRESFAAEKVTDEQDNAPLVSNNPPNEELSIEKDLFYAFKGPNYPEPEIKREEVITILGISNELHPCIFREHLPGRMFSFLNVLSPNECSQLINKLDFNEHEVKESAHLISAAIKSQQLLIRTNIRRSFIDDRVAKLVWGAIKTLLPSELSDGRKLSGVRSKMNYYRYGEGQYFKTHLDGGFRFTQSGDTSEYTFVIYLNDDFVGGTTRYCPLPEWNSEVREVKPIQGGMLIFRQSDLKHCGVTVVKGFKHILQGMVMYGPIKYNNLGKPFGKPPQFFKTTTCDCE